jgi:hypothetical protein
MTIIDIRTFLRQLDCIIFILQEPWLEREGQPPTHPDFDLYTPTPIKSLWATYIRRGYNIVASTEFTHGRSFLGSHIINNSLSFYLYNFYSPGYLKAFADLCKSFTPKSPCILMGDLNPHHPLWYGHGGGIPNKDLRRNAPSNSIAEWFSKFSFLLHNEPGVYTHFPRAESFNSQHIQHSRGTRLRWHKADWMKFNMVTKDSGLNTSNIGSAEEENRAVTSTRKILTKSSGGSGSKRGNTSKTSPIVVPES